MRESRLIRGTVCAIAASAGSLAGGCDAGTGGKGGSNPTGPGGPGGQLIEIAKEPAGLPPGLPAPDDMRLLAENPGAEAFDDPTASSGSSAYLPGAWRSDGDALLQEAEGPGNKLMVRRYIGPGSGAGGILPERYRIQVSTWQYRFKGRDPAKEMGVLAVIPYWRDAKHFLILSAKSDVAELWAADDTEPGQTWPTANRYWTQGMNPPLAIGDAITWDVVVSVPDKRVTVYMNGERKADAESQMLAPPASVAIAANGNQVKFKGFKLWASQAAPTRAGAAPPPPAPAGAAPPAPAPAAPPAPAPAPAAPPASAPAPAAPPPPAPAPAAAAL